MTRTAVRYLAVLVVAGVAGAGCAKDTAKGESTGARTTVTAAAPAAFTTSPRVLNCGRR